MLPDTDNTSADLTAEPTQAALRHFQPEVRRAAADPRRRHRQHANPFAVRQQLPAVDSAKMFGRRAPLALDIGCGAGQFTRALAAAHPDFNVLGVEIRPHFIVELENAAVQEGLPFCRGLLANANLQLIDALADGEVAFVSVNFPDPWFKKRHHKRRVLTLPWLLALLPKLAVHCELHVMTDYAPLADDMRQACLQVPALEPLTEMASWPTDSTTGLVSERELTHSARGEPIFRMAFKKRLSRSATPGG